MSYLELPGSVRQYITRNYGRLILQAARMQDGLESLIPPSPAMAYAGIPFTSYSASVERQAHPASNGKNGIKPKLLKQAETSKKVKGPSGRWLRIG